MNSDWPLVSIDQIKAPHPGSIAIGPFGSRMKTDSYVAEGVRVVRGTNLTGGRGFSGEFVCITPEKAAELGSANLRPNDLVFPHRGSIGEVGIVPDDGVHYVISSSLMKMTCASDLALPEFLYYFFKSNVGRFELLKNASQVGTPGIGQPLTSLKQIQLRLPSAPEQKSISSLLRELDNRIELLRETNATLEAIAHALFKSWFVDFDPVRANARGLSPDGIDSVTASKFPKKFAEGSSECVPEGWSVEPVYGVASVIYGAPFASARFNAAGIGRPLVRIRDLKDEAPGVFTDEAHPKGYLLQPGDIAVGMDGEFRAYLWGGAEAWLNQRVCVFQPRGPVPSAFVRLSIQPLLAAVEASETATTVIHLGKNDIDRFKVTVPTEDVMAAFADIVNPIYQRVVANKRAISSLASLRDTLLPRLISGQLRLPEARAELEEAT